jgi:polyvinyl alcohol dehydrogenase (cytochrome)
VQELPAMNDCRFRVAAAVAAAVILRGGSAFAGADVPDDTAELYKTTCAVCHDVPATKAPATATIRQLPAARILMALEIGRMQPQAAGLKPEQRQSIAKWLAAAEEAKRDQWITDTACARETPVALTGRENWGLGRGNHRLAARAGIDSGNVDKLELLWSIALPSVTTMRSQPVIAGDTVFLGSQETHLLALDRASGCVRWAFGADAPIRTALTLDRTGDGVNTIFFADEMGTVYAIDATTGKQRWRERVKWFPTSVISGPLAQHADRLFVPVSSFETAAAGLPSHECCRSHGGIAALDARTGKPVWRFDTTAHAAKTTVNSAGVQMWGPSGAPVWNMPLVDARRGLLYFGTGQNYSSPATDTSDAIIALDLATGEKRWSFQALANDAWNAACLMGGASCPAEKGPDFDFGAALILVDGESGAKGAEGGGSLLLAGQKSGDVYALDPDRKGAVVWRRRIGQGSTNGGVHHGMATDGRQLIVPIADPERAIPGYVPKPGVYALSLKDGALLWAHPVERGCAIDPADAPKVGLAEMQAGKSDRPVWPACTYYYGQSAAVVMANNVVYAGALDGKLRIIGAQSGKALRTIDTNRAYRATNGVEGHGGAIDVAGAVVDGSQLFVLSGYGMFGQMPGNMLLVYGLKDAGSRPAGGGRLPD